MASFEAKTGGKGRVRVKIKINVLISSYPNHYKEFQKKTKKEKRKKKKQDYEFFQAKTGWQSVRKSENKNYRSDQFLPDLL